VLLVPSAARPLSTDPMRPTVPALLSLLCLPACSSLSSEDASRLTSYQRNAQLFYEGRRFEQAMGQVERGLELDPDDYKLRAIRGTILLRVATEDGSTNQKQLEEATRLLTELYAERSPSRHEPYLLLSYGQALQKRAQRHLGESIRLEGEASRTTDVTAGATLRGQAGEQRQLANEQFGQARDAFAVLIERGELLRFAHNHRMQIARLLAEDRAFLAEAQAFLQQNRLAQEATQKRLTDTPSAAYEEELFAMRRELVAEELEVRSLVASFHYDRLQFAEAKTHLDRVLVIDPRRFVDYYNRGRILLELGEPEAAKKDFRVFLADPSLPATSDKASFALRALNR
jgi:hypothetical protein